MQVWKIIFLSKWLICRFQPFIFQGVPFLFRQLSVAVFKGPKLMEIHKPPGSFALSSRWGWTTLCFYGWGKKSCRLVDRLPYGSKLGRGFKYFLCSSLFGDDSQFDYYFFRWVETTNQKSPFERWITGVKFVCKICCNFDLCLKTFMSYESRESHDRFLVPCDIGAKESGVMYIPTKRRAKAPENPQNDRVVSNMPYYDSIHGYLYIYTEFRFKYDTMIMKS